VHAKKLHKKFSSTIDINISGCGVQAV